MTDTQSPASSQSYPEASKATMILVLGILGLVVSWILAPFAWVMGNRELEAIREGRRPPDNRSTANAGRILGIIGTVLLGLAVLAIVLMLVVGFAFMGVPR
jgi:hypothetical protein